MTHRREKMSLAHFFERELGVSTYAYKLLFYLSGITRVKWVTMQTNYLKLQFRCWISSSYSCLIYGYSFVSYYKVLRPYLLTVLVNRFDETGRKLAKTSKTKQNKTKQKQTN